MVVAQVVSQQVTMATSATAQGNSHSLAHRNEEKATKATKTIITCHQP
jgi:hypothetical protein